MKSLLKRAIMGVAVVVALSLPGLLGRAEDAKPAAPAAVKAQTVCPVMAGPIDKKIFADSAGKRVYFCCADCQAKFKEDPAAIIKKLEADGITLEKVGKPQTMCPLMNEPIDRKLFVDYQGKRVYLCCNMCVNAFKKDPAKVVKQMEDQGIILDKTPAEPAK